MPARRGGEENRRHLATRVRIAFVHRVRKTKALLFLRMTLDRAFQAFLGRSDITVENSVP
jgi:hypothetical protein